MMDEIKHFHAVDYIVFVFMFAVSMAIGLYFGFAGSRQKTTSEYLMGGRNMKLVPVTMSLVVTIISANTLLGAPAEIYSFGIMYWFMMIGMIPATIVVALYFVPLFFPLGLTSANEYLEMRFRSRSVRWMATLTVILNQLLYVGTVIFGPATALEIATGCSPWASIVIVSVIGTAYTAVGGMKAVVWTDFFQSFIMVGGMICIIILGALRVGGGSEVWRMNNEAGRIFMDYRIDPTARVTIWTHLFGYMAYWIGSYGVNQSQVQRFCGMSTMKKGKIAILVNGPLFAMFQSLACGAGMVAFAYYAKKGCDPMAAKYISNSNQIIPYFVMDVMSYPGLPGLFVSSLFSGSLSTLSSSISALAAVVWEDMLKEKYSHTHESRKTLITKCLVIIFGFACMGVAFMVLYVGGNLIQLCVSFSGATIGPLLGLFVLGALFPWANWKGALAGVTCSLAILFWMMSGQIILKLQRETLPTNTDRCHLLNGDNFTSLHNMSFPHSLPSLNNNTFTDVTQSTYLTESTEKDIQGGLRMLYSIAFAWYSLIAVVIVLVVGIIVSLITGLDDPSQTDETLFFPCLRSRYGRRVVDEKECFKIEPTLVMDMSSDTNGVKTKLVTDDSSQEETSLNKLVIDDSHEESLNEDIYETTKC